MRIRQGNFAIDVEPVRNTSTQALRGYQYTLYRTDHPSPEVKLFVSRMYTSLAECRAAGERLLGTRVEGTVAPECSQPSDHL